MRPYSCQTGKQHFTLVEIVLALAILLLLAGIAITALTAAEQTMRKVNSVNQRLQQYLVIDRLVNRAFKNAIYFTWPDDNAQPVLLFDGQDHTLFLCYLHRVSPGNHAALRFLRLFREEDRLVAEYSDTPILPGQDNTPSLQREIIASGVNEVSFLYAGIDSRSHEVELRDHWDGRQEKDIPSGIQMQIDWKNGRSDRWFRRTAGAGYRQQRGRR